MNIDSAAPPHAPSSPSTPVQSAATPVFVTTAADSSPVRPVATVKRFMGIDERFVPPLFITCILVIAQLKYGVLDDNHGILKTGMAIGASILTELILGRLLSGKWPHWASAYISGISVGILVRSPYVWPYLLCSTIAISSKYVLRYHGKHLWNPSNFGIVAMLIVAPTYVATLSIQWGNSLAAMVAIWILGSVIIYRLNRLHICATYVVSFIAFAFLRGLLPHSNFASEVAPITGPMYQLFIFFMITDPKTTVKSKKGQMLVAFLVAATENFLRMVPNVQVASHAPYFALTIVGPICYFLYIRSSEKNAIQTQRI